MIVDYPERPAGTAEEQIATLWEYLYKLAEKINVEDEQRKENAK